MNKKVLLIFGSEGALGKGITYALLNEEYDEIYLYDMDYKGVNRDKRIVKTPLKDLSVRQNAAGLFNGLIVDGNTRLFLVSTIGGYSGGVNLEEFQEEETDRMLLMNFKSAVNLMQEFVPLAKNALASSVILTSAMTSLQIRAGAAVYGASKSALNYLVRSLAEEGKSYKMSVNAIAPNILDTPANRVWVPQEEFDTLIKPEEVGKFIGSFFRSSHFISGNIIQLNYRFPIK